MLKGRHHLLIALCCGFQPLVSSGSASGYALVADAGSTSSRMYLFHLGGAADLEITDLGKGPALSSFAGSPSEAAKAVEKQLEKAKELIPEQERPSVPVAVFATAGMRLVEESIAAEIYAGLRAGILTAEFPFNKELFQARTISGREEGVYALLAANYLSGKVSATLELPQDGTLLGVLDLGGSSTQIALPPHDVKGGSLLPHLNSMYVRSFLSLGMEKMRQRTYKRIVVEHTDGGVVANPCAFPGYEAEEPDSWIGVGSATDCERAVRKELQEERASCQAVEQKSSAPSCLPSDPVKPPPASPGAPSFYLISGYLYVLDFASWWLQQSGSEVSSVAFAKPQVDLLRRAASEVCAAAWDVLIMIATSDAGHKFTQEHKVPHRCFELNYIIALLTEAYGFEASADGLFEVVAEVNGNEIEWTLGAFLASHAGQGSESTALSMEL